MARLPRPPRALRSAPSDPHFATTTPPSRCPALRCGHAALITRRTRQNMLGALAFAITSGTKITKFFGYTTSPEATTTAGRTPATGGPLLKPQGTFPTARLKEPLAPFPTPPYPMHHNSLPHTLPPAGTATAVLPFFKVFLAGGIGLVALVVAGRQIYRAVAGGNCPNCSSCPMCSSEENRDLRRMSEGADHDSQTILASKYEKMACLYHSS